MATKYDQTSIRYLNFSGMLNNGVADFLIADNELTACKNVWCYKLGKLEKVPGYEKASTSQVVDNNSVSFLHWYFNPASSSRTDYLFAVSDSSTALTIEYIAPNATSPVTTFTTLTGISTNLDALAGSSVDMENYLGKTFMVGHKTGDTFCPNATITGVTYAVSDGTNLTNMPQGKFVTRYRDLLYVAYARTGSVTYPSRAYYCDDPVAGAITWLNNATQFIDFGYDDGDEITGTMEAYDRYIVFKKRSMWKYDENSVSKVADVGCDSYRSIQKVNDVPYWFNRYGFWRWTATVPELVSEKAKEFIDAISQTTLGNVVATVYGGFEYRAFIGTVTVGGDTYTNAWFCFDTRRDVCYIRCTSNVAKSACNFIVDSKKRAYFGDDDGYVYRFGEKVDAIYSDNGNDIDSFFITKNLDHGIPEDVKFTNQLTTFTKNGRGIKMTLDINNEDTFSESTTRTIRENIDKFDISGSGNRFRYRFSEKSSAKSFEFEGFTLQTQVKED